MTSDSAPVAAAVAGDGREGDWRLVPTRANGLDGSGP